MDKLKYLWKLNIFFFWFHMLFMLEIWAHLEVWCNPEFEPISVLWILICRNWMLLVLYKERSQPAKLLLGSYGSNWCKIKKINFNRFEGIDLRIWRWLKVWFIARELTFVTLKFIVIAKPWVWGGNSEY